MGNRETIEALRAFVAERDWDQFHTIPNLAKSVSLEAAELLEHFQWSDDFDADGVKVNLQTFSHTAFYWRRNSV